MLLVLLYLGLKRLLQSLDLLLEGVEALIVLEHGEIGFLGLLLPFFPVLENSAVHFDIHLLFEAVLGHQGVQPFPILLVHVKTDHLPHNLWQVVLHRVHAPTGRIVVVVEISQF